MPKHETAVFAGGCFWCLEAAFEGVPGVRSVTTGYSGGRLLDATYEQVSEGDTGHYEAVRVVYDPSEISYDELLDVFWHNIDPTDGGGQFADRGTQYRTAVFYADEMQHIKARASKKAVSERLGYYVATEVAPASAFYPAEPYHQDYYKHSEPQYRLYYRASGRSARLKEIRKALDG